jgi:hypothetical protein
MPAAKLGRGNYVYVYGGGYWNAIWYWNGVNYFGLSVPTRIDGSVGFCGNAGTTVQEAYSIDKKIDDGLPQSGNVLAQMPTCNALSWANGVNDNSVPYTTATAGSSTTCYDNGNVAGATQQYSVEISNGSNVNCALSFRFQ